MILSLATLLLIVGPPILNSRLPEHPEIPLWPAKAVGDYGTVGEEHVRAPEDSPTRNAKWLTGVTRPTITLYRPRKGKNTGVAIIVCPGGGYWNLAWDLEGEEVAEWLSSEGITAVILKYRVPRRAGQPEPLPAPLPLLDAQRAVSLVRSKASEWRFDPSRVGMVGFSAGGHLTLATAGSYDHRAYDAIDEIDRVSCRPDFVVPVYPGYLVDLKSWQIAPYIKIPDGMPPVLLIHASDDTVAGSEHSAQMYLALKRAGVPAELHIYGKGGHGFGVRKSPAAGWKRALMDWLRNMGFLVEKP